MARAEHGADAPEAADPHPSVLFSCSLSGTVLAAGAVLGRLSGRPLTEVPGAPAEALLHPASHDRLRRVLRAARDGAASGTATFCLRNADGSDVEVGTAWSVLSGASADATQLVFVCADPSVSRTAQRRLRVQEALGVLSRELAVVADAEGTLLYASPAVEAMYGYEADDVLASDVWTFIHPDDVPSARAGYEALVTGGGSRTTTLRVRAADGDWRWVELVAVNQLDDVVGGVVCAVQDITAEVEAKQALRASEARFRAIADASEEGIWVLGRTAETLYANKRLTAVLGMPPEQALDLDLLSVLDPDSAAGLCGRLRTRRDAGPERYEFAYPHPDGHERRLRVTAAPLHAQDGTPEGTVAMVSDITDVRRPSRSCGRPRSRTA